MRWILGFAGALGLLAAAYLGMRERLTRPVLRVALDLQSGRAHHEEILAGVRAALDERDERGGRFRVEVIPDLDTAETPVRLWLPGLHAIPEAWSEASGAPLIFADVDGQAERILDWAKARGLRRVALPTFWRPPPGQVEDNSNSNYAALGLPPSLGDALENKKPAFDLLWFRSHEKDRLIPGTLEPRPELVVLEDAPGLADDFRASGFSGPLFLSRFVPEDLASLDGCLTVLAPLKPPPTRWPSPFAYAGYLATIRFLDALDHDPAIEPEMTCLPWVFDELRGEPRVYEIRDGKLVPR